MDLAFALVMRLDEVVSFGIEYFEIIDINIGSPVILAYGYTENAAAPACKRKLNHLPIGIACFAY